ncbi:phosphoadenylyl-sulfate reductase [Amnibacterium endophyticum]|uniref:Adenosine 5'-phosphosulfate reductase n=1 Tax=Amnibacterium endophyticum TaxID=2109337 RepID=A0ABW4LAN7_9MICO
MTTLLAARRTTDELEALARRGADELGEADALTVVEWVAAHFDLPRVAVASSMANAVLPHLVSTRIPGVAVLFLDTGYHFAETLETRDEVRRWLDVRVVNVEPERTVNLQDQHFGPDLNRRDPEACCRMRKVYPLTRALEEYEVWFSGMRREEAPTRANTPLVTFDARHGLVKVNPLAAWTTDEMLDYAERHAVPVNPLLADGYPSIGCAPCTQRVAPGADPRSGRWAGLAKTECGIHL